MVNGPGECFESLWDAVMSVDDATMWHHGLQSTGLNLLLQDSENRGIVLVPKDNGVLGCNASSLRDVNQWPYGDCAKKAREWLQFFAQPDAASILMYQWIPNQTFTSLARDGSGVYETLLTYATDNQNNSKDNSVTAPILISPGMTVSLPNEMPADFDLGFESAEIVDVRDLCDSRSGGVYVLDKPVYPTGLTKANATSLPGLNRYCSDSILSLLSTEPLTKNSTLLDKEPSIPLPSPLVSTFVGLVESSYPALPPLFSPTTNVTLFAPYTEEYLNVLKYVGLTMSDIVNFRRVLPPMTSLYLNHFVPGRYCPDDFKKGLTLQTVAGNIIGRNDSLYIVQDDVDENKLHIEVLFGDDPGKKYSATYLGQACSSVVYTLDSFLTPWISPVIDRSDAQIPYSHISDLPEISQQSALLDFDGICRNNPYTSSQTTMNESVDVPPGSEPSSGVLVGIVLGSFILMILCICGLWWGLKMYKKKTSMQKGDSVVQISRVSDRFGEADTSTAPANASSQSHILNTIDRSGKLTAAILDELVLTEREVSIDVDPSSGDPIMLGHGKFGTVVRGKLLGAEPVAIKCVYADIVGHSRREISSEQGHRSLRNGNFQALAGSKVSLQEIVSNEKILHEIALLKSCHSQYIVSFLGVVFRQEEVWLVTELFPSGDLWHMLRNSSMQTVTWYKGGIFIAMDILAGLKYLHNKRIIHLDLKSSNILLRTSCALDWCPHVPDGYEINFRAKISDVGLSRMLPISREYISSTTLGGTWNWCAPEVILCSKCTSAADMFSFGVVLWEICTGEMPLRGRMRNVRVPLECPQEIADLINACIGSQDPKDRPTASDAFEILNTLLQDLVSNKLMYSI